MKVKSGRPDVTIFNDHEVINPPNRLARAVSKVKMTTPDDDPVARAEAALAQLSSEFAAWMQEECERLDAARKKIKAEGLTKANVELLYHAAHDIKGEAETFGYPCVAPAADSLCRVIEHTPDIVRIPLALMDQHVDAIRAIIREYARPDVMLIAQALTQKLRLVTEEFLVAENKHRPDYLETIPAPMLAS
ncbi:MAG: Hpt domain-containing protein [Pseudorhodoplanes sp.]